MRERLSWRNHRRLGETSPGCAIIIIIGIIVLFVLSVGREGCLGEKAGLDRSKEPPEIIHIGPNENQGGPSGGSGSSGGRK